jgi:uncharacterized protein
MIEHLPERLDLLATAGAGRILRGPILLTSLERLLPSLVAQDGELQVVLELGRDPDGTHFLAGSIQGAVQLQCQRCLEAMQLPLDLKFRLGLVRSQEAAEQLPDRYEPLLVTAEPARTADIVSDEVLLALPIVPLHADRAECLELTKEYQSPDAPQRDNPFAVLAELKQKH